MKKALALVIIVAAIESGCLSPYPHDRIGVLAHDPHEYMFVAGNGQKAWYSALELEQIARRYADEHKLEFKFEGTEKIVWVKTDGGRALADVFYSSGMGQPVLHITVDHYGKVIGHEIAIAICGIGAK